MRSMLVLIALSMLCLLGRAVPTQVVHLKEYVSHTWSEELISYKLTPVLARARALRVTDAAGKQLPYQVQDGRIYLLVTLPADGELTFTVTAEPGAVQPEHPAQVSEAEGKLTLDSGVMALRLSAGKVSYPQPVEARTVPGPLQGVRQGAGGWIGSSAVQAPLKVTGYTTTITAKGPLFAEATITYAFEGKKQYRFTARVIAGQPTAILDEWMDLNPGGKYYLLNYKDDVSASTWEWWNLDDINGMTCASGHGKTKTCRWWRRSAWARASGC